MRTLGGLLVAVTTALAGALVAPAAQATCYTSDCDGLMYVRIAVREPAPNHRATIRVRVASPTAQEVTGRLVVRLRRAHDTARTFRAAYEGQTVRIRTGRLAAGKYVAQAIYRPADASSGSAASSSTTFRVRRR